MKKTILKYFTSIFGVFIIAFIFNLVFLKNGILIGDILGISIIVDRFTKIDIFLFLIAGYLMIVSISNLFLDINTIKKTILPTILLPIFTILTFFFTEQLNLKSIELILLVVAGSLIIGIGYGFLYKEDFSFGGVELIARIINKYFRINLVYTRIVINIILILIGIPFVGVAKTIYGILAITIIHSVSSKMLRGEDNKTFYIITSKYNEIKNYFIKEEKIDVTILDVEGGHKNEKRKMIMSVIRSSDYFRIRKIVEEIDKDIFITIVDSYELINQNQKIRNKK